MSVSGGPELGAQSARGVVCPPGAPAVSCVGTLMHEAPLQSGQAASSYGAGTLLIGDARAPVCGRQVSLVELRPLRKTD